MKRQRELLINIRDAVDDVQRGKGASVAKGRDYIGRQQLEAKTLMEAGYDRKITVPTHTSEYPDQHAGPSQITFRPEPKDKALLREFAGIAHRTYRKTRNNGK